MELDIFRGLEGAAPVPRPRLASAALFAVIGLYVTLALVYALEGRYVFFAKTGIVPLLFGVAVVSGRAAAFAYDWAVFLSAIALFDCFRGLVYAVTVRLSLPIHAWYAVHWDEVLLGGESLPVMLQHRIFRPPVIGPLEKALVVVHGSHFVFWMMLGMAVWLYRRDDFYRFRRAIFLLMGLGLAFYFIVPTVPPWMASDLHLVSPITHITAIVYKTNLALLHKAFDINPVAAMPSLHTAFCVLCAIIGVHHFGRRAILLPVYAAVMLFAIAYTGEHYLVDIVAGIALASFVYWVAYRSPFWQTPPTRPAGVDRLTARSPLVWHVSAALLMLVSTEGVVQLCGVIRPADDGPTPSFVQNELAGHSDLAHWTMADALERAGRHEEARRELELSLGELRDPARLAEARARLGMPAAQ